MACYAVFKYGTIEEHAQLCFELLKMAGGSSISQEYIQREHVHNFIERMIQQNEQLVHSFYAKTEFDPRVPIRRGISKLPPFITYPSLIEDFIGVFKKVHKLEMFTWVPRLVEGYRRDCMNMDDSLHASGRGSVDLKMRLTLIQSEKARSEAERMGFAPGEHEAMQELYQRELRRGDAKSVRGAAELMFKDVKDQKLRKYFV